MDRESTRPLAYPATLNTSKRARPVSAHDYSRINP